MFIFFVLLFLLVFLLPFLSLFLKVIGGIANLGTLWSYPRRLNDLRLDAIGRNWLYLDLLLIVKNVTFIENILWGGGWRSLCGGRCGLSPPRRYLLSKEGWIPALSLDDERLMLVCSLSWHNYRTLRFA